MMGNSTNPLDPDRFLQFKRPGSQEWWYFDAISSDGRDVLVIVWYAGLPFDPKFGVAALRHLKNPSTHLAPNPLDHSAIGFQWYRDGKTIAYALNAFPANDFRYQDSPIAIDIAGNVLERGSEGYRLRISTPSVDTKTQISADLRFRPAPFTKCFEKNFGTDGSAHVWILAAPDCVVEGNVSIGSKSMRFLGRGYHDHNAGEIEISRAIRRWEWGRVHKGDRTDVFYFAEPKGGQPESVWLTCRDGEPVRIREELVVEGYGTSRNVFGMSCRQFLSIASLEGPPELRINGPSLVEDHGLQRKLGPCLDDGPFYRRWIANFGNERAPTQGICELLDTRNLNRRLFNWMIPYRLKRPRG